MTNSTIYRTQTKILGEELHQDIHTLVNLFGIPDTHFASDFTTDTGLPFNRNVLGFKTNNLTDADLHSLSELKIRSLQMAAAAKGLGRLGFGLDIAVTGDDIYQTCKQYGDGSKLCHKDIVADTTGFSAGQFMGYATGTAFSEWAGCNALLDLETAGTGILICTVTIGLSSITANNIFNAKGNNFGSWSYNKFSTIYQQHFNLFKKN